MSLDSLSRLYEIAPELEAMRRAALSGRDPTCADETLKYILGLCEELCPKRILEVGCAEGLTSTAMLLFCEGTLTGIELDPFRRARAEENFEKFGVSNRVRLHEGDAAEILPMLEGEYDLIFSDGPKVQYLKILPELKRLLRRGGVLLSDDVLLFGWVRGTPPAKRRMLARHIEEFLDRLERDPEFETKILPLGEGLAVSRKRM